MKPFILYKVHENADCDILQSIVRYLYAIKVGDIRPISIVERNMPPNIKVLPTIVFQNGYTLEGINNIANYYEKLSNTSNLINKSVAFCQQNPDFRINNNYTQKNLKF